MKLKYTIILACALVTATTAMQAQILMNNGTPEILVVNQADKLDTMSVNRLLSLYRSTLQKGFGHLGMPGFVITGKNQNFTLGIGGNVAVRTSYDFNGIADNKDFVTSAIPVPNSPSQKQQFMIDPTTSSLFFQSIYNSKTLGPIQAYIEANFRGSGNSFSLRKAYITLCGFLVGRYYTTFYDTKSTPSVVDFEGPNNLSLVYRTMIRYIQPIGEHFSVGAALESNSVNASTGDEFRVIHQRMPDIPIFAQYTWNDKKSHVRISAIIRDMFYFDNTTSKTRSLTGWGASLTGSIQAGRKLTTYFGAMCGEGIAAYIQDISNQGLDMVTDSRDQMHLQTLHSAGWNIGAQYVFDRRWTATAVYSGVKVFDRSGFADPRTYNLGQYVSANVFNNITDNIQIGLSYMYGSRKDLGGTHGHANRVQGVIQYNF